jgi:hypothetical protein
LFEKRGERRVLDTFSQDMEKPTRVETRFWKMRRKYIFRVTNFESNRKGSICFDELLFRLRREFGTNGILLRQKKNDLVGPKGDEIRLLDFIIYLFSSFTSYSHIQGEIKNVL